MKKRVTMGNAPWDEIRQAVAELNNDLRFQKFMEGVAALKDEAVLAACDDETLKHERIAMASIGTIRAFQRIIDLAEHNLPKNQPTTATDEPAPVD